MTRNVGGLVEQVILAFQVSSFQPDLYFSRMDEYRSMSFSISCLRSISVTHRYIYSECTLQKLLGCLPDWLSAARAMSSVASKAGAPQVDNIYSTSTDAICS